MVQNQLLGFEAREAFSKVNTLKDQVDKTKCDIIMDDILNWNDWTILLGRVVSFNLARQL